MISVDLLIDFGAIKKTYSKDDVVFKQGQKAKAYHQLVLGEVKMNNYNEMGKEFIQRIFSPGESFGEPPLFGDFAFPANAIALKHTAVMKLPKPAFFELLRVYPDIHLQLTKTLSMRLHYKSIMAVEMSFEEAGHRILRILDYLKKQAHGDEKTLYEVTLTRQQIADLTGLRVETVIRTVKKLAEKEMLELKGRKIFR